MATREEISRITNRLEELGVPDSIIEPIKEWVKEEPELKGQQLLNNRLSVDYMRPWGRGCR